MLPDNQAFAVMTVCDAPLDSWSLTLGCDVNGWCGSFAVKAVRLPAKVMKLPIDV